MIRLRHPLVLLAACTLVAMTCPSMADTHPTEGLVNYETPHVHPIDLTPDGRTLLAVNTAAHRLEIYDVSGGSPVHRGFVPVGLDPVSVRARTSTEAWVVNQISDSVSIVSLEASTVVATLKTDNEPADVVFAGDPQRAFVSCADANTINVFDPAAPTSPPQKIAIAGEEPCALAASPDGRAVYAAIFESGNGTTVLNGRAGDHVNVVSRPEGPYAGQNPPPNQGDAFNPPIDPSIGTPPEVSLIVKQDPLGRWLDDNAHDWSVFVSGDLASLSDRVPGWNLQDNDVAIIDVQSLTVSYQRRLLNMTMAIAVHPLTGRVCVVGTDAINQVRFEPNLNGRFLRVNLASFLPGDVAEIRDLNPHLDYSSSSVAPAVREQSLGDPRGIAWRSDGSSALITGMGSNNIAVVDSARNRLTQFAVGEGPTGIVLNEALHRGYVMNKFSGSISVIDLDTLHEVEQVPFDDPTPQVIKDGRPLLYNTHLTSGTGHVSCASCHVDARTDRLVWDLGDPRGPNALVANASNQTGKFLGDRIAVSAMKGPMQTQTLQDIMKHPSLHWRGDRGSLADFSAAYQSILGADAQPSPADMTAFGNFLATLHLPPNPYRNLNNTRPATVTLPNGSKVRTRSFASLRGANTRRNNCLRCHLGQGSSTRNFASNQELGQAFVAQALTPFYKRLGYWNDSVGGSTSGVGFFHDGSDTVWRAARTRSAEKQQDMLAELMTLEGPGAALRGGEKRQDTHAGVGQQITINGKPTTAQRSMLSKFISIAATSRYAALIAKGRIGGSMRGFYHLKGSVFQSDRATERATLTQLLAFAAAGQPITFTIVAQGTEQRLGVDADLDGVFDGDEP